MKQKKRLTHELKKLFSGRTSEIGRRVFNRWFDSFDDSSGWIGELDEQERKRYRDQLLQELKDARNPDSHQKGQLLHKRHENRPIHLPTVHQHLLDHSTKTLQQVHQGRPANQLPDRQHHPVHLVQARRRKRGWAGSFYRVAAILLTGFMLSVATSDYIMTAEPDIVPVQIVERSNPYGRISRIVLPDSSRVWLNAMSTLSYPEQFDDNSRMVTLEGEAYVEVQPDASRPFVIESGPVSTHVTGTSFNVKAYEEDGLVEITLKSGSVDVHSEEEGVTRSLRPDQKIAWKQQEGLGEVRSVVAEDVISWIHHEFVFVRESFATIARTFERWYGVEFIFEDRAIEEEQFVYHFKDLSLENSLRIMKQLADFDFEISGRKVFVRASPE